MVSSPWIRFSAISGITISVTMAAGMLRNSPDSASPTSAKTTM